MKNFFLTFAMLPFIIFVTGCANLKDKGVNIMMDSKVGKVTFVDPSSGGNPLPSVWAGSVTGMWNDCPPGCKFEAVQISYKLFQNQPSTIQTIKMDATTSGKITLPVLDALLKEKYITEEQYKIITKDMK